MRLQPRRAAGDALSMVPPPATSPTRPALFPRAARQLPWLGKTLVFLVLCLAVWLVLRRAVPATSLSMFFQLWLLAALLGLSLAPRLEPDKSLLRRSSFGPAAPPVALLLTAALFNAVHGLPALWPLLPVFLAWFLFALLEVLMPSLTRAPLCLGAVKEPPPELLERLNRQNVNVRIGSALEPGFLQGVDLLMLDLDGPSSQQQRLLEHAHVMNIPVVMGRAVREELMQRVELNAIDQGWLTRSTFQPSYLIWKRLFDVGLTLLLTPVLLPLMAAVALVVLINSGRPVLFWQERVGRDGVPFRLVKFRTMTRNSEQSGPAFAQQGDMRVTPVGAFLRKFRLDELPQFWNVLCGEMSVIGPRPEQWAFASEFEESIPLYGVRHWVRPGITGWAQVHQGYAAGHDETAEKLSYDFYYVKHLSLWTDLRIVYQTIVTILTGFGAR